MQRDWIQQNKLYKGKMIGKAADEEKLDQGADGFIHVSVILIQVLYQTVFRVRVTSDPQILHLSSSQQEQISTSRSY